MKNKKKQKKNVNVDKGFFHINFDGHKISVLEFM